MLDRTGVFAAAALAGLVALMATGSRAGCVATAFGAAMMLIGMWILRRPAGRRLPALLLAAGAVAVAGLVLGTAAVHFGPKLADAADRMRIYGITMDLIAARPWTGYGLGSFPTVFAAARPETVSQVWTKAHNVYLELAFDLGVPAAALLVAAVLWLLALCVRGVLVRRDNGLMPVVGLAASVLIGSHALLDFSAQIPAVAVTWMAMLGVAVAQSWPRASRDGRRIREDGGASFPHAGREARSAAP